MKAKITAIFQLLFILQLHHKGFLKHTTECMFIDKKKCGR